MTFKADYPGAIVVEAANYGYTTKNRPKRWGFHTPEEEADDDPQTPGYIAGTKRNASYTYFVSYLAFVFQLVPESEGAYAHALNGKPAPDWSDGTNLNLQSFSLAFEGYAATIHQTMLRGSPQWKAAVDLVAHRTKALGLNLDESFQHKDVSIQRSDCGQWDQAAFIADVKAKMNPVVEEEEDMKLIIIKTHSSDTQWVTDGMTRWPFTTGDIKSEFESLGLLESGGHTIVTDALMNSIPTTPKAHEEQESGSNGLSFEKTVEANQEAARRGTRVQE